MLGSKRVFTNNNQNNYVQSVNIPIELFESMKGEYFVGYAENLLFGKGTKAWARLYNPYNSGVNLHVNVWTVSDISAGPYNAQFWFNANPSCGFTESKLFTCSNTAIWPVPVPKSIIQKAINVTNDPYGGAKAFVRTSQPGITIADNENGKFIFPPGGSFLVLISLVEGYDDPADGRIAFGWWEEKIPNGGKQLI
ncbi:hypothetical protein SDC9_93683 [bioreactor metagenome]|uniref:Uncharacterized protein n=1 Tax=bioreactor metagenome TaxID=1076179 RepID=A0A645A234_9ZZZZ|nr:DUF6143 family protein [Oscillospiraceae bacterium]